MATNTKAKGAEVEVQEEPVAVVPVVQTATKQESVYTAEELAKNYAVFGTYREIVVVALRLAGKKTATLSEAKEIITNFKNKEVKK